MNGNEIAPVEALRIHRAGGGILLDVRTPAEFAEIHALAARPWPLDRIPARPAPEDLEAAGISPRRPALLLCRTGPRAREAGARLAAAGVETRIVAGGTLAWEAAGLPAVRGGGRPIPLERQVRIAAGALVLLGTLLGRFVAPPFLLLSGAVGAGLVFAGVTDRCGLGLLLSRAPWNRR